MRKIEIDLKEHSYPILLTDSFLGLYQALQDCGAYQKVMVVTEPNIRGLYGEALERELSGVPLVWHEIPGGEECKTLGTVSSIYQALMEHRFDRKGALLALGGGIVGDITGFAAATYMRGISYVQVPTTLLAQVDSSVGGKTGVNLSGVKNSIGAFYQPKLVFANLATLSTLSERDYKSGLGEVAKYGVLKGQPLFDRLLSQSRNIVERDSNVLAEIVACCCEIKADIVGKDERENGIRAILNLGHTFGHAYETATHHAIHHGEGVALGMISACKTAEKLGLFDETNRVMELIQAFELAVSLPDCSKEAIMTAMQGDKKQENGRLKFVLPYGLGDVRVTDQVSSEVIEYGVEAVRK